MQFCPDWLAIKKKRRFSLYTTGLEDLGAHESQPFMLGKSFLMYIYIFLKITISAYLKIQYFPLRK